MENFSYKHFYQTCERLQDIIVLNAQMFFDFLWKISSILKSVDNQGFSRKTEEHTKLALVLLEVI